MMKLRFYIHTEKSYLMIYTCIPGYEINSRMRRRKNYATLRNADGNTCEKMAAADGVFGAEWSKSRVARPLGRGGFRKSTGGGSRM